MRDITIGQFFPGNSSLHRMDPRVKLVLTFLYVFAVFIPRNWIGLSVSVAFLVFAILLSKLPINLIFKSIKPILPLVLITSALNIFYISEGAKIFEWGFIHITTKGLVTASFIAIRIICLISGSSLLTYTTSPTTLTDALERLLSPLKAVKLDVHELAMMMTIALRFIPTLIEETDKIMSAQKARGADIESGGIMQRIRALIPIVIPLFVSSFRRAYELATAMECRCYRGGEGRTRMKQMNMRLSDAVSVVVVLIIIAALFILNFFIKPVL
jgi:energy-coupling factor transport system permease protein